MPYKDVEVRRLKDRERARRKRRENPEYARMLKRAYYARHAEKIAVHNLEVRATKRHHAIARQRVQVALKEGILVRGECEVGGDCLGEIHAHHDDYSKPLEVRWLCQGHHMQLHLGIDG